jgi:hypothetical protein
MGKRVNCGVVNVKVLRQPEVTKRVVVKVIEQPKEPPRTVRVRVKPC